MQGVVASKISVTEKRLPLKIGTREAAGGSGGTCRSGASRRRGRSTLSSASATGTPPGSRSGRAPSGRCDGGCGPKRTPAGRGPAARDLGDAAMSRMGRRTLERIPADVQTADVQTADVQT